MDERLVLLTEKLKTERETTLAKLAGLRGELRFQADPDAEEGVADLIEHEMALGRIRSLESKLAAIDHAWQRVLQGTYGICERCGERIDLDRLEIMPETTLCIQCKTAGERSIKMRMRNSFRTPTSL